MLPVTSSRDGITKFHDPRPGRDAQSQKNDALKGAALAFGKPAVKPKPQLGNNGIAVQNGSHAKAATTSITPSMVTTTAGSDDHHLGHPANNSHEVALAAATKAGSPSRPLSSASLAGSPSPLHKASRSRSGSIANALDHQHTGQQQQQQQQQQSRARLDPAPNFYLQLPHGASPEPSKSPSLAAARAASRSVSLSPNHTSQPQPRSPTPIAAQSRHRPAASMRTLSSETASSSDILDTTSIPPTTSLIGMFEKNTGGTTEKPDNEVKRAATVKAPVAPPKPKPKPSVAVRARTPSPQPSKARHSEAEIKSPTPLRATEVARTKSLLETQKPRLPPLQSKPSITTISKNKPPNPTNSNNNTNSNTNSSRNSSSKPKPSEPQNDGYESSDDESFVSASDYQPSWRAELQSRRLTSPSMASVDSSAMIDSMANAIVASSLASRAVSPSKASITSNSQVGPPPPPPRRHLFHNHHSKEPSRTPSPAKPPTLRTTLRKNKPEDEVDEPEKRRYRKNLVKKHPNKHHEGDRKRWRDAITERERKRYEAVWASNKGLFPSPFIDPAASAMSVCSLVVRDIYSRSRLNDDELEEVYNLVDRHLDGRLQKEEFVVGLWLIDQRLKGRKLPPRVSESVWRSVGLSGDIKVKGAKHR